MRIAIRRLRALLALFRPHLAREEELGFTKALRQLGRILGEARDWDVFCTETLIEAENANVPAALLQALWRGAEIERRAAHARLAWELEQPPLTRMVLGLLAWAEDPAALTGSPGGGALSRPLTEAAPDLLDRLLSKAKKRGRRIRHLSEEELHDLRRALKRLRYAIEFFAPLLKAGRLRAYLHHCKELQEDLGTINDAAMAKILARRLREANPALRPAAAEIESWAEKRRAAALAHLHAAWREFKDAPRPWLVSG